VVLENGQNYRGSSLYKGELVGNEQLPLVYGKIASRNKTVNLCLAGSLDPKMVSGKIVLCDLGGIEALVVQQVGSAGLILANGPADGEDLLTECYSFSSTTVVAKSAEDIKDYINNTRKPRAAAMEIIICQCQLHQYRSCRLLILTE
jgi:hypothetical protein